MMDFHEITYKPQELRAQEEQPHLPESPSRTESDRETPSSISTASIYSDISSSIMDEIKAIDLDGSFGTKIDTLARHILWLRENDPGAKSIIFSQYRDFLSVLSEALTRFKIGHTSIGVAGGIEKFRQDASVECFLLDAKSDSSGLNLVNATHVFLCEPLINTAIELQAIARVHRIGQQRPTTVYMYLIRDTVEEAIYDISVSRRLAHISRSRDSASSSTAVSRLPTPALQENMLDKANSLEMEQAPISNLLAKGKSGGEIVDKEDLWKCLFGKARRESKALPEEVQRDLDRQIRADAVDARRDATRALTP
jgi:E3 ubiquitin-protein ligase SHPRH